MQVVVRARGRHKGVAVELALCADGGTDSGPGAAAPARSALEAVPGWGAIASPGGVAHSCGRKSV